MRKIEYPNPDKDAKAFKSLHNNKNCKNNITTYAKAHYGTEDKDGTYCVKMDKQMICIETQSESMQQLRHEFLSNYGICYSGLRKKEDGTYRAAGPGRNRGNNGAISKNVVQLRNQDKYVRTNGN